MSMNIIDIGWGIHTKISLVEKTSLRAFIHEIKPRFPLIALYKKNFRI